MRGDLRRSPEPILPKVKEAGSKVIHKLTSVRHAETAQRLGGDAVMLIGFGLGGRIGLDNIASLYSYPAGSFEAGHSCHYRRGLFGGLSHGGGGCSFGDSLFPNQGMPGSTSHKGTNRSKKGD